MTLELAIVNAVAMFIAVVVGMIVVGRVIVRDLSDQRARRDEDLQKRLESVRQSNNETQEQLKQSRDFRDQSQQRAKEIQDRNYAALARSEALATRGEVNQERWEAVLLRIERLVEDLEMKNGT